MIKMLMVCANPRDNWIHTSYDLSRGHLREHCRALWEDGVFAKPLYIVVIKPKWSR